MSDFELLKSLQGELIETLNERKKTERYFSRSCGKAKVRRLRLQIAEVMLRIERKCDSCFKDGKKEKWE